MPSDVVTTTFLATGVVARVREVPCGAVWVEPPEGRVEIQQLSYADHIEGLAPPTDGVLHLVSRVTAAAALERADLVFPQDEVRDEHGRIIGCRAMGTFAGLDTVRRR